MPEEKLAAILERCGWRPTSSGLQPFEVIVVKDPELRAKIRAVGFDQPQITDASHLLVFAALGQLLGSPDRRRGRGNRGAARGVDVAAVASIINGLRACICPARPRRTTSTPPGRPPSFWSGDHGGGF